MRPCVSGISSDSTGEKLRWASLTKCGPCDSSVAVLSVTLRRNTPNRGSSCGDHRADASVIGRTLNDRSKKEVQGPAWGMPDPAVPCALHAASRWKAGGCRSFGASPRGRPRQQSTIRSSAAVRQWVRTAASRHHANFQGRIAGAAVLAHQNPTVFTTDRPGRSRAMTMTMTCRVSTSHTQSVSSMLPGRKHRSDIYRATMAAAARSHLRRFRT